MNIVDKSDYVVIVFHEIYGINDHMLSVCDYYRRNGFNVICPNLLDLDCPFDYTQEKAAYKYFMEKVGFEIASRKATDLITQAKQKYKHVILLGFSIGATIAWLCSGKELICDGIIGYYGSRIRNYMDIVPNCKTLLIFAAEDEYFNVMKVSKILNENDNIETCLLPGKHGFSNPFYKNYCENSHKKSLEFVDDFINKLLLRR